MDDLAQDRVDTDGADCWANHARRALRAYVIRYGDGRKDEVEQDIGDLLCDLRHLADAEGIPWTALTAHAEFHYTAEI